MKLSKLSVNYLFFGIFFAIIATLHCFHVCLIDQGDAWLKLQYIINTFFQCFLEALVLAAIACLLQTHAPKWICLSFIGCTMVIFLLHCVEFFLMRLMDISIQFGLGMVFDETLENFIEMLLATHVPLGTWILAVLIGGAVVIGGMSLYLRSQKWIQLHPIKFKKSLAMALGSLPLLLIAADRIFSASETAIVHRELAQALPWKRTFLGPRELIVALEHCLSSPPQEQEMLEKIGRLKMGKQHKPDLFLFVIESLRPDYITEETAPHLHRFKQEFICPEVSLASGNGTQLSWFSIFYSKFPFYFSQMEKWKSGGLGLRSLKELGYQVHVLSSTRLSYYRMDQRIFGQEIADSFSLFPADDKMAAHESDWKVFEALSKKIEKEEKGGRCFIIFLESTHFGYSFPEGPFAPYDDGIKHLQIAFSMKGLEKVKNRYRNAIHYTDCLFGQFVASLKKSGGWDEAMIVVTGDHGEEFYENGHLFHASNLSPQQINVPLYFKLGSAKGACTLASHIDIFPSVLHYLLGDTASFEGLFDGESIFSRQKWPYAIVGRYNGSRSPYEFLIHNGESSLLARFNDKGRIFNADALHILEMDEDGLRSFTPALRRITGHP
jgi:glucan phosphoethanolaminetransferase (alkaline phosphatase superfamily)